MPRHQSATLHVDELERRDAPATFASPTRVTYQDADGDAVAVTFSKPILTFANVNDVFAFDNGSVDGSNAVRQQLWRIALAGLGAAAAGTSVTVTSAPTRAGGDGLAAVGQIDASGIDLGVVRVDGDLGRVLAGDADTATTGLKGLLAQSLGRFGTITGASDLVTAVQGRLGCLTVRGDVREATVRAEGGPGGRDGAIGPVFIGGSLIGGNASFSGQINATGDLGMVTIRKDLVGGRGIAAGEVAAGRRLAGVAVGGSVRGNGGFASGRVLSVGGMGRVTIRGPLVGADGVESGEVSSGAGLAGVTVGGSVTGGGGDSSGRIASAGNLGSVTIRGDLNGASGDQSGYVSSTGKLAAATVGGSVHGGSGTFSGRIDAQDDAGVIDIGGDLVGGSADGTHVPYASGLVYAQRISRVVLGGSLIAGSAGYCGAILAGNDFGAVLVKGSLIGNTTNPVLIVARGSAAPTATRDVAIGSLTVLGRVEFAQILAGIDLTYVRKNDADAGIGAVRVGGDWTASNLAAGADAGSDGHFGTDDDSKIYGSNFRVKDDSLVVSRIASVTIGGHVAGTAGGADHFGIVAESVGAVNVGGVPARLAAGPHNDNVSLGSTDDFTVLEVAGS